MMIRHFDLVLSRLFAMRYRLLLWLPLLLMIGVGLYFSLPQEPRPWLGGQLTALALTLAILTGRWPPVRWGILLLVIPVLLGFSASQWRTQAVQTPLISVQLRFTEVKGDVREVLLTESGARLLLENVYIEGVPEKNTPVRVRIAVRKGWDAIKAGDRVRMLATLYPLPRASLPGGYDFRRHFYFQRIGGVGFAMGTPEITQKAEKKAWQQRLQQLRQDITSGMLKTMSKPEGAVAAALAVGEKGAIPEATKEDMRVAGLAHILSISGLHLALAAGVIFFWVRLLLVALPGWGARLPTKKIAAVAALGSAFAYLLLAGTPIPAQRAVIMVSFVLIAILFNREGISLYSLAWAAVVILLLFPESMLGPSFQMSFAATLAIVGLYERYGKYLVSSEAGFWRKVGYWVIGLAATSLVASFATAPFVIYHFNRLPILGLVANMAVMPLAGFVIMPALVLSYVLMPFGAEGVGYWILEKGIAAMLYIANWTTNMPYSAVRMYSLTDWGVVLAGLGLMVLVILRSRWRWLGFGFLTLGIATSWLYPVPHLLVGDDGKQLAVQLEDGRYAMAKGARRAFTAEVWRDALAQDEFLTLSQALKREAPSFSCKEDKSACYWQKDGHRVAIVRDYKQWPKPCTEKLSVLHAWWYLRERNCPDVSFLLDRDALEDNGAHALTFDGEEINIQTVSQRENSRPWHQLRPD